METDHWGKRLDGLRLAHGLSIAELGRQASLPADHISKYIRGVVDIPRGDAVSKLARALNVTEAFLLFGTAKPTAPDSIEHFLRPVLPLGRVRSRGDFLSAQEEMAKGVELAVVPREAGPLAKPVRVEDQAMAPTFPAGTIVVIDPDKEIEPGAVVLAFSNVLGRCVVRRWRSTDPRDPTIGLLVADNPNYPHVPMSSEDGELIGRATFAIQSI